MSSICRAHLCESCRRSSSRAESRAPSVRSSLGPHPNPLWQGWPALPRGTCTSGTCKAVIQSVGPCEQCAHQACHASIACHPERRTHIWKTSACKGVMISVPDASLPMAASSGGMARRMLCSSMQCSFSFRQRLTTAIMQNCPSFGHPPLQQSWVSIDDMQYSQSKLEEFTHKALEFPGSALNTHGRSWLPTPQTLHLALLEVQCLPLRPCTKQ